MATAPHSGAADDGLELELEKVAVGPYCVIDAFKPTSDHNVDRPTLIASPGNKRNMETHILENDFTFNGMRHPWANSGDDMPPTDGYGGGNWNEFMQWDAASQSVPMKPLNAQGPVCYLKQEEPRTTPLLFNRRQSSQSREPLDLQSVDVPTSTSLETQMNSSPYNFGGDIRNPTAFGFDGIALSSPSSGGGRPQTEYYSPPIWEQQAGRESAMFAPQGFEQANHSPVPAPPASTPSLHHSPGSLHNGQTSSSSGTSSPEPTHLKSKKRKSASEGSDSGPSVRKDKQPPIKKTAHNMIEKRYRTNLNDKIAALRDSVPSLRVMSRPNGGNEEDDDPEDLEGLTPAHKLNKATVLSKATEYIRHLEKRNKRLQDEVNNMKARLDGYDKMSLATQMGLHGSGRTPDVGRYHDDHFSHQPGMVSQSMVPQAVSGPPQGLIPVPESMANLHRGHPPQPHYAQHKQRPPVYPAYSGAGRPGLPGPPQVNGRRSSGMLGKLMVGSLAGIMMIEGFTEHEQSSETSAGRGLFALPINLASILAPRVSIAGSSAQIPIVKVLLIFIAVFYLVAPLFSLKPKQKKSVAFWDIARAPSLASPVEVRRKAWLTATQTVWVPGHHFWLEVAALGLKTLKLSTRKLIGWDGYALLTGITKEQEAARVKAWNIALDAQLTGGDAEISKSRLVLTLMASGTLPNTPVRLMLKALHIRVLLWEFANTGSGGWGLLDRILNDLSAKWARSYWIAARSEQKIAINMASKTDSDAEPLSGHLAALLELDCDEVLIPCIIQREYNLAWNRPNAERTTLDESMDGVVDDFSICSPLDALAAWWSCYVLQRALTSTLASKECSQKDSVKRDLELASRTAPPTSQARMRALVAQAIILDEDRSNRITAALEALPISTLSTTSQDPRNTSSKLPMNLVSATPMAADIRNALTLAKCHVLVGSGNREARCRAIEEVNKFSHPEATNTLLSFVAGYKLLNYFVQDEQLRAECNRGLECLVSSLRIWIGQKKGERVGLSNKIRQRVVGQIVNANTTIVGFSDGKEIDDGYVSSSEKGD